MATLAYWARPLKNPAHAKTVEALLRHKNLAVKERRAEMK